MLLYKKNYTVVFNLKTKTVETIDFTVLSEEYIFLFLV
jgi:hypothetical protein